MKCKTWLGLKDFTPFYYILKYLSDIRHTDILSYFPTVLAGECITDNFHFTFTFHALTSMTMMTTVDSWNSVISYITLRYYFKLVTFIYLDYGSNSRMKIRKKHLAVKTLYSCCTFLATRLEKSLRHFLNITANSSVHFVLWNICSQYIREWYHNQ